MIRRSSSHGNRLASGTVDQSRMALTGARTSRTRLIQSRTEFGRGPLPSPPGRFRRDQGRMLVEVTFQSKTGYVPG
jgi:hypothetical protein